MDQDPNNGVNRNSIPAPLMGADGNVLPNNGANIAQPQMVPQGAQMQSSTMNMNMGGSAPVVNQPGVSVMQAPQQKKSGSIVETIVLILACLIAAVAIVVAVIFFLKYNEANEDQQAKIDAAVATAVAEEQATAAKNLEEKLKEPYAEFRGPDDYGRVSFRYPKTWNVYVDKDGSDGSDFVAYFQPNRVQSLSDKSARYALRFAIYNRSYDTAAKQYISKVDSGKMRSQTFTVKDGSNQISGMRYDGEITTDIIGTLVIFKVNDKVAMLQTDSDVLMDDFEKLLTTLRMGD